MSRPRRGASVSPAQSVTAVALLFGATLVLVSCQALGLPVGFHSAGSSGTSTQVGATERPARSAEASVAAEPTTSAATTAGAAERAEATVQSYLDALVAGHDRVAWQLLAPSAQAHWPSESAFTTERTAFYASAGPSFVISPPDGSVATLDEWLPPAFDGDRGRAFVIAVDHPAIHSNASREVLVAAPDAGGRWRIWIAR